MSPEPLGPAEAVAGMQIEPSAGLECSQSGPGFIELKLTPLGPEPSRLGVPPPPPPPPTPETRRRNSEAVAETVISFRWRPIMRLLCAARKWRRIMQLSALLSPLEPPEPRQVAAPAKPAKTFPLAGRV